MCPIRKIGKLALLCFALSLSSAVLGNRVRLGTGQDKEGWAGLGYELTD